MLIGKNKEVNEMELDERKQKILQAIIRNYMETGEPVGSRTISKYSDLNLSSATIRNEMSDLEEMGYIVQPHTSAGRIPSDKGYRLYVDHIMEEKNHEVQELKDLMIERTDKMEPGIEAGREGPGCEYQLCHHGIGAHLSQEQAEIYPALQGHSHSDSGGDYDRRKHRPQQGD